MSSWSAAFADSLAFAASFVTASRVSASAVSSLVIVPGYFFRYSVETIRWVVTNAPSGHRSFSSTSTVPPPSSTRREAHGSGTQAPAMSPALNRSSVCAFSWSDGSRSHRRGERADGFKAGDIASALVPEPWASRLGSRARRGARGREGPVAGRRVCHHPPDRLGPEEVPRHDRPRGSPPEADTLDAVTKDAAKAKDGEHHTIRAPPASSSSPRCSTGRGRTSRSTLDPIASTLQVSADHGVEVGTAAKADLEGITTWPCSTPSSRRAAVQRCRPQVSGTE